MRDAVPVVVVTILTLATAGCSASGEHDPSAVATSATANAPATANAQAAGDRPQIWFGPLDPWSWDRLQAGSGPHQYYDLFRPDAPWSRAAGAVDTVRLYPGWLESYASPQQLKAVLSDLAERKIAISYEAGPLPETAACNAATAEGFAGPPTAYRISRRIHEAGATLSSMDLEHPYDAATYGPLACRMSPEEIARGVSDTISAVRGFFASVSVGSIETAGMDVHAVAAWLQAFRTVTGHELAYFHLDPNYTVPDWASRAKQIEDYVRSWGVPFGIIYTGNEEDASDESWLQHAEQRFVEYEVVTGGRPDHVIFQSWHRHPQHLLPETEPGTFTHLINRYLRQRTALTARLDAGRLSGSLTNAAGGPIVGATVSARAQPARAPGLPYTYKLSGVVPAGARTADVGYRINTECDCSGAAALTLYRIRYSQDGGVNRVPNGDFAQKWAGWGAWGNADYRLVSNDTGQGSADTRQGNALRIRADRGQDAGLNSGLFQVTPGSDFTVSVTARVDPVSVGSGYFQVIFLDGEREVGRHTIAFAPGQIALGTARTDASGMFTLTLPPDAPKGLRVTVRFGGDEQSWPAVAALAG